MERQLLFLTCLLCYLRTGSLYYVENKLPQIIGESSGSKTVNSGENIELVCESDMPAHWFYPQVTLDVETLREEDYGLNSDIKISTSATSNGGYHSVLKVINASYLDTGYYSCIANITSDVTGSLESSSRVYVYVRDSSKLWATNETFMIQVAKQYQAAVIPCRPTSLDVNVSLWRDNVEIHPGVQDNGVLNISYNPTIGYTLDPINIEHNGIYICKAVLEDVTEDIHYYLEILWRSISIPKPSINGTYVRRLTVGEKLYLECTGRALRGMKFSIAWRWPRTVQKERVKQSDELAPKVCVHDQSYACSMRSLTIENVTLQDRGLYTCEVTGHNQIKNNETKEIKIYEAGQSYINLTVDSEEINVSAGAEYVQWVINMDATPLPSYNWFSPQHTEIKPKFSTKFEVTDTETKTQVMLKIKDIGIQDAGVYVFEAYVNENVRKELNLTLIVNDKPAVDLESDTFNQYYQLGKIYPLKCKIVGHPQPQIQWSFMECDLHEDCERKQFIQIPETGDLEIVNKQYIYTLKKNITMPGTLKCFANNSQGNGSDVVSIFVTDLPSSYGFTIWGKPENVVAGDNMTLHCGATKYNYTQDIRWYERRTGYPEDMEVENTTGWFVTRNDTEYSYGTTITMINVLPKSDADYLCVAKRKEDELPMTLIEEVHVLEPEKPYIRDTNLNGTDWLLESGNSLSLKCQVGGLPQPSVSWYKNGEPIGDDPRIVLEDNNQSLWIQFAKLEDEGAYKCEATNRLDTISKHINLLFKDGTGTGEVVTKRPSKCICTSGESKETRNLSTDELQRILIIEQLELTRLQKAFYIKNMNSNCFLKVSV